MADRCIHCWILALRGIKAFGSAAWQFTFEVGEVGTNKNSVFFSVALFSLVDR